jgi:hypothetical protein
LRNKNIGIEHSKSWYIDLLFYAPCRKINSIYLHFHFTDFRTLAYSPVASSACRAGESVNNMELYDFLD